MDARETWQTVAERLAGAGIDVLDELPHTPRNPYYLLTVTPGISTHRTVGARGRSMRQPVQVMAVNNSFQGCLLLIQRAVDLLDGWRPDGHHWLAPDFGATHPYAEEAPGDYRWSSSVGFIHTARRNNG